MVTSVPEPRPGVVLVLGTSAGGVGRHVAELATALTGAGVDVRVAGPAATLVHLDVGVPTTAVEIGASLDPVRDLRAAGTLRRAIGAGPARGSVVHAHGVRAGLVATLATRSLRPRPPLVVTLHNAVLGAGPRVRLGRAVQALVARSADVVLAVSGDLVHEARRAGARTAERALVPAPVRPAGAAAHLPGTGPVVLVVARLAPQKGLDTLLDAVARIEHPVRVVVAGDGPLRASLTARVQAEGLSVEFLGARSDVSDLLAAADVVVGTSRWEGQPVFLQEALRAGVAIVATDAGGTREVTGDAALLVPVGDAEALAAAVDGVLADDGLRGRWAAAAAARARDLPTTRDTLAQVLRVHEAASAARRTRRPGTGTPRIG